MPNLLLSDLEPFPRLRILDILQETSNAKTFIVGRMDGQPLIYKAGQFITLVFQDNAGMQQRRSYSFSSGPPNHESPAFTVKKVENGIYSRMLLNKAEPGMILSYTGVSGFFQLPEVSADWEVYFFFAAGSGITPIFSLIKTALFQSPATRITLVYSNRSPEGAIFLDALKILTARFPARFELILLFSENMETGKARLNNFMITGLLKASPPGRLQRTFFFLCGPVDYMDTIKITLLTEGISESQIRKETFRNFQPAKRTTPPDRNTYQVRIRTERKSVTFPVQYPVSILDAALEAGVNIPFSCRSGQCGSCSLLCANGKVWMEYNEVLTPREIEKGVVLTCTGYPVEGDVDLTSRPPSG